MATESYDVNDTINVSAIYTDGDGVAFDPETVAITIYSPDGTSTLITYPDARISKTVVGTYRCGFTLDLAGPWSWEWLATNLGANAVQRGDVYAAQPVTLVVRTTSPDNVETATTFGTLQELDSVINRRPDIEVWASASGLTRLRAVVQAYEDLIRLLWQNRGGNPQSRLTDFPGYEYESEITYPPLDDPDFVIAIRKAQAIQALYILAGTQVRDMAREGISLTRALSGSEMEIRGHRGTICAEAKEVLGRWVVHQPRLKRMAW